MKIQKINNIISHREDAYSVITLNLKNYILSLNESANKTKSIEQNLNSMIAESIGHKVLEIIPKKPKKGQSFLIKFEIQ